MSLPRYGVGKPQGSKRHGMSVAQIESIRHKQRNACAICLRPLEVVPTVDHDHELAKRHRHDVKIGCVYCVRALLCRDCNLMLGFARDNIDTLRAAVAYLTMWEERRR